MTASTFITQIRTTLQDVTPRRWTDIELEGYMNEGLIDIAVSTMCNREVQTVSVVEGTTSYTLDFKAIRFDTIDTNQYYSVTNNDTLEITDPIEEEVEVVYYAYFTPITVATDDVIPLEQDFVSALKSFVLKRCYEKEDSTENFRKASYFNNEYLTKLARNSVRWEGLMDVTLAKQDYYN
jgi:hypothetical protein